MLWSPTKSKYISERRFHKALDMGQKRATPQEIERVPNSLQLETWKRDG